MMNYKSPKLFWNTRYSKYGKLSSGYTDEMIYRFDNKIRWSSFINVVNLKNADVILDVGCNHGSWSIKLAKMGMKVIGIDIISEAIETAKKSAKKESIQIKFKTMKIEDVDFKNGYFNKIISVTVMQHLLDDKIFLKTLKKFQKQLKNDGELILIESAANNQITEKLSYKRERSLSTHINLCKEAGFKLLKIRGISHLSVKFYYGIEYFSLPITLKKTIQYVGLVILNPIDIFLAKFKLLSRYSNLKLMVFNKI